MNLLTSKRITFPLLITLTVISNTIIFQSDSTSESLCVSSSVCVNLTLKIISEDLHPNWECQQQLMEIHTNIWTNRESERWRGQETTIIIIIIITDRTKGTWEKQARIWQQTDSVKRRWCLLVCFYFTFRIQSVRERQTGRHVRYDRDEDPNNWFFQTFDCLSASISARKPILIPVCPQKSLQTEQNSIYERNVGDHGNHFELD